MHAAFLSLALSPSLIAYVLIGPCAWLLFLVLIEMGRARMSRLRRPPLPLPASPPSVAILIPAKDEGEAVRKCLDSVLAQDYPDFTVVAIDDRSTDVTGAIFDEYSNRAGEKFRAVHIATDALPP